MTTEQPVPATLTALLSALDAKTDTDNAPVWFDADEARGFANGVEHAADLVRGFVAAHPAQFQSFTAEQHQAIKDLSHLVAGFTRNEQGRFIDPRAARTVLYPITHPEGGAPAMAPYLSYRVTLDVDGSPVIATFDSHADARAFADLKSAHGERHVVRF